MPMHLTTTSWSGGQRTGAAPRCRQSMTVKKLPSVPPRALSIAVCTLNRVRLAVIAGGLYAVTPSQTLNQKAGHPAWRVQLWRRHRSYTL